MPAKMQCKGLGVAVIGCGRMGRLRACLVASHPAVNFVAISDSDGARARTVAEETGAHFHTADNGAAISRAEVNAVIVSTSESQHAEPVVQALEMGKSVLVEKPMAMTLADADCMLAVARKVRGDFRVGYTRRFKRSYLLAKEQVASGRLGQVVGATFRAYNSRAQTLEVLQRSPDATPIAFGMTYYVDLLGWFLPGNPVVEVIARGHKGALNKAGYGADDITLAILTLADGTIASMSIDYALPENYPTFGTNSRVEILGTEGIVLIDDDSRDQIVYTDHGIPHTYVPGHSLNFAFMGSTAYGDWIQGEFWGPMADETRSWLDHLATGRPCSVATAEEGRRTLEVTFAVEQAARTNQVVTLPLDTACAI